MLSIPVKKHSGNDRPHPVRCQIPSRIIVSTHVRFRDQKHGDKFDDFVERTEPHAGKDAENEDADRGSDSPLYCALEAKKAEPHCDAEPVRMHQLIVFKNAGNDPKAIEYRLCSM